MKSFKSPQKVIIVFLTLFILICCFFIVRLEIKAANLQSQWDEHKKSLNENMDVLNDLKLFARNVKSGGQIKLSNDLILHGGGSNNHLILDPSGGISFANLTNGTKYFGYDSNSKYTFMRGVKNGNVFLWSNSGENYLNITDDMVAINTWDKNKRMVGLDILPSYGKVEITSGGNRADITLQKKDIFMDCENEISFKGKTLKMENASGKCKIRMAEEDIHIVCAPSNGPVFGLSFSPDKQLIACFTDDASITLAKDVVHFEANGDINITSKNGNVNIKGNKVKVNE